ncbi:MAG: ABC transporter ATP-binding protein, partial [Eubacteriales bacterium]|nr:ABC transporter ATP-binding protein [Eubacteriales bacterium]
MNRTRKTASGRVLRRLLGYLLRHWPLAALGLALSVASNYLALLGPRYLGEAIDAISSVGGVQMRVVMQDFWKMLLCYGASAVLAYLLTWTMVQLSQKIIYRMRKQLFENLTTLPVSHFDTHPTGDIVSRISYDIDTVNASLSADLVQVLSSIYTVLGSLYFMWIISKPMILVFAITVPISILFTREKAKKIQPLFRKRSKKLGELNGFAEEMLSGAKTIGAYHRAETITQRFDARNDEAVEAYYDAEYYGAMIGPSVNFINNLSISLVMIFGGILYLFSQNGTVSQGTAWFITIGGVTQFVMYSRKFAGPINEFANIISEFQSAFTAAERIFRIMDETPETPDAPDVETIADACGDVEIRNVEFGYVPEKTVLHNLSLHAKPGQTVAIVGPTGAGKTTLINLLMRFYEPQTGSIFVDGTEIHRISRDSLRGAYTMVLQDTWLFYGTILENITYGREDATMEEVVAAAKAAKIHSFIEHLPEGYNTLLSDDGVNISKGQKQLITIARAMLPQNRMLILDEATSNVDSRTEIRIQNAMTALMQGRTCFVIAHRLSTVQNADIILVVKDGNVIEQGNHE